MMMAVRYIIKMATLRCHARAPTQREYNVKVPASSSIAQKPQRVANPRQCEELSNGTMQGMLCLDGYLLSGVVCASLSHRKAWYP